MSRRRRTIRNSSRRGIASLEFVMILPVLLILLFGVMEMGWMLTKSGEVVNAAREGARMGARPDATSADINSVVSARMTAAGMGSAGYTVNITPGAAAGDTVTVEVTVPYDGTLDLTSFPLVPRPAQLHAQVSMQKEGP